MFNPFPEYFSRRLPEDYLFRIVEELSEKHGKIPDSLTIRSAAIIRALGLPAGPYSAIEVDRNGKRVDKNRDRIIAEFLTNHPGIEITNGEVSVVSRDPRDIYPQGLPRKLARMLHPATREILKIEYDHLRYAKKLVEYSRDPSLADCPIHYMRLPGGIDLIERGYRHNPDWQRQHGRFLAMTNRWPSVICVEGLCDLPYGQSIPYYYSLSGREGKYDALIKDAVENGFKGLLVEVDARDTSIVTMDPVVRPFLFGFFPHLPNEFFEKYYQYLLREQPSLSGYIQDAEQLKQILTSLSSGVRGIGIHRRSRIINFEGKNYYPFPYVSEDGQTSWIPTILEFGQQLSSDALAAIKLIVIGILMQRGYIPRGPIIDYEGAGHLSSKTFFLENPQYAMEVVLRTINELMAGRVDERDNLAGIYRLFNNPDWLEVLKEIVRLVFYRPTRDGLEKIEPPVLAILGIDPSKVIPSEDQIKKIQERFS